MTQHDEKTNLKRHLATVALLAIFVVLALGSAAAP